MEDKKDLRERIKLSRRKFLKWSMYVPPAVISILASATAAEAQTCNPNDPACVPNEPCQPEKCVPNF